MSHTIHKIALHLDYYTNVNGKIIRNSPHTHKLKVLIVWNPLFPNEPKSNIIDRIFIREK